VESPRAITAAELPALVEMVDRNLGAGPLARTGRTFLPSPARVYTPENLKNIFVIREAGQIVALRAVLPVARGEPRRRALLRGLHLVDGHRGCGHRGCGHGLRCLRACLAQMEAAVGCDLAALNTMLSTVYFYGRKDFAACRGAERLRQLRPLAHRRPALPRPPRSTATVCGGWAAGGGARCRLAHAGRA
jgi:hypothetical protein